MSRYIDADALGIGYANPKVFNSEEYARGWNSAIEIINSAPTVSPDEVRGVVHCRECDLWNRQVSAGRESLGNFVCSCDHWTVEDGAVLYTEPTDFCSYGERMVSDDA